MPLRVAYENGRKITPRVSPSPGAELSPPRAAAPPEPFNLRADLASVLDFASQGTLARFAQTKSEFCWAACAQMIANYYQVEGAQQPGFQCRLAELLLREEGCRSSNCESDDCNQPCFAEEVAALLATLGINAARRGGAIEFNEIVREIQQGRPVEVGLEWEGGGKHLVVIYGWSPNDEAGDDGFLKINDPLDRFQPDGEIRHSELLSAYGAGEWIDTWTDVRRRV